MASSNVKDIWRAVWISFVGLIATLIFDIIYIGILEPEKIKQSANIILDIKFDLIVVALALILSSYISDDINKKARQFLPVLVTFICLCLIFLIGALSRTEWYPIKDDAINRIYLPMCLGVTAMTWAAYQTRNS